MNKEELEKAIVEKIEEMESPEYEFPERFSGADVGAFHHAELQIKKYNVSSQMCYNSLNFVTV